MDTKAILVRAVQVVSFLFAAFGHFLINIAPPQEGGISFAVGFASLLSLGVFLFLTAISKNLPKRKFKRHWIIAAAIALAIAFVSMPFYYNNFIKYTFRYPYEHSKAIYFKGDEFTQQAGEYLQENPDISIQTLLEDKGGLEKISLIWTEDSIRKAKLIVTVNYIVLVLSLATAISCLMEGIINPPKRT